MNAMIAAKTFLDNLETMLWIEVHLCFVVDCQINILSPNSYQRFEWFVT